ncbi:MAG: SUMF1/EgtB/PvdO family nonheme iron enzyme [Candidatus Fonsibacter sp.]
MPNLSNMQHVFCFFCMGGGAPCYRADTCCQTKCVRAVFCNDTRPHGEWQRFQTANPKIPRYEAVANYVKTDDSPEVAVSWFTAAEYCNWLSEQEGIAKEQWCYEERNGVLQPKPNALELKGYRLPTEAEW